MMLGGGSGIPSSSSDNQPSSVLVRSDIGPVHTKLSGPVIVGVRLWIGGGPFSSPSNVAVST